MSLFHALVLGVVQGLAEFLPISSSGHLELVPWLFGWDDFAGDDKLENAFDVSLHLGTTIGAIAYLWSDVKRYVGAGFGPLFRRDPLERDGKIAWFIALSAVPAVIAGVALEDALLGASDEIWLIAVLLIVFGVLLGLADRLPASRSQEDFTARDAILMGLGQACALLPGVSRSGSTLTVARGLGFDRSSGARLAFLMALPIIAGAGLYRGLDVMSTGIPDELVGGFIVGFVASAVTGWVAVWGTLRFVRNRTFLPFVTYRIIVGASVLLILASGWR
ncbi:MAG: undecaprenyl-diphosphate phosphatase [Actinomycetia bacterium]|nr:undecaprenyl-diphosphate phosphatase [Actinomycetes bacterium]MCP4960955.1 undecaprenyl-diphosphate phosphatase [Actinomycetes bacterium]